MDDASRPNIIADRRNTKLVKYKHIPGGVQTVFHIGALANAAIGSAVGEGNKGHLAIIGLGGKMKQG